MSPNADLAKKSCRTGKAKALTNTQVKLLLGEITGWKRKGGEISKTFSFKDYYETLAFVNATAWISHRENHHPDLEVGYNKVTVRYSTHSVGGLSEFDFICAAKIETMMTI
jgi:4a-hydroxytetrahydrobiopterin dehydratase